jgi:lipoyl(octanoyl) transferase
MLSCRCYRWGEVPYQEAWARQRELASRIAAGEHPPALLLLSHPPTYTFGRSGHAGHLLMGEEAARRQGIEVVWVDRGGDVTYHGPGQIVGYPLLPLGKPHAAPDGRLRLPEGDYVGYLRRLEDVLIRTLAVFGVKGFRMEGMTGVWVRLPDGAPGKIAAIGVKVDARGISQHGFALNVRTNPAHWAGIVGCGLHGYAVANLADVVHPPLGEAAVLDALEAAFSEAFGCRCESAMV